MKVMQLSIGKSVTVLGLLGLASTTATGNVEARDEAAAAAAASATSAGSYCVSAIQCLGLHGRRGEQS